MRKICGCKVLYATMCLSLVSCSVCANEIKVADKDKTATEISIYNQNLAMIRNKYKLQLAKGKNKIAFENVAKKIQPQTAIIESADVTVIDKSYEYDVVDYDRLLRENIGKKVKTMMYNPTDGKKIFDEAKLLSVVYGRPILQFDYGIETDFKGQVVFDKIPDDLYLMPTLKAGINNSKGGNKDVRLFYLSKGLQWNADYVAEIKDDKNLNLSGFVTIDNKTGTDFKQAKVELVSGEVNEAQNYIQHNSGMMMGMRRDASDYKESAKADIKADSLVGRYVYSLPVKVDIDDNQTKQFGFLQQEQHKYKIIYQLVSPLRVSFYGAGKKFDNENPDIKYELQNEKSKNMPSGVVRFYKKDNNQQLQFIGSDKITTLAKGEKIQLNIGKNEDVFVKGNVTAKRKITDKIVESDFAVEFNNSSDKIITVEFLQKINGEFKLLDSNLKYKQKDAETLAWNVEVPVNKTIKLTYSLRIDKN